MALITNTDPLLANLDYANLSTGDKAIVDGLIVSVQTFLEEYLNRKLELATFTSEKLDGTGHNSLFVLNPPIRTLTSVVLRITDTDSTTYNTNYFEFDANKGEVEFSPYNITSSDTEAILNRFPRGRKNILVTYDGGLSNYDIKIVAADLVRAGFDSDLDGAFVFERLGAYAYRKESDTSTGRTHPKLDELMNNIFRRIAIYRIRKA